MKKIILSNITTCNGNRGCVALSLSTMYILQQVLEEHGEEYEFYLPQSGFARPEYGKHVFASDGVKLEYAAMQNPRVNSVRELGLRLLHRNVYESAIQVYKTADAVFDIGQGDSFADIYGEKRFETIYSQYELGMKYKIPYCILPQTIGPYKDPKIRERAVKGIKNAKLVMVRDRQSYDYVKEICGDIPVTESIDVAFFMPYQKREFDHSMIHVGLNVSALLWHGGYTRDNQFGLKLDYQKLVRDVIDYFLSQDDIVVHLVPHVVGAERTVENDYAVSSDLVREYANSRLVLAPLFLDPIEAKGYIAGMDFFMGARMHATIAAFSSGVPVCPMAYSRKFNGLFEDTLQYPHMVDLKGCGNEEALEIIKRSFKNRERLKTAEEKAMDTTVAERYQVLRQELTRFLGLN